MQLTANALYIGPKFLSLQGFAVIAHLRQLVMRNLLCLNAPSYSVCKTGTISCLTFPFSL